jgi:hypothetical protein
MRSCDKLTIDEKEMQNLFISTLDIRPMNFREPTAIFIYYAMLYRPDHIRRRAAQECKHYEAQLWHWACR